MGPEFFIQIAKLRAFRLVWAKAVESFGGAEETARTSIHGCTARWNATLYDPQVNILRATTEALSAVLGGADSISISPFDDWFRHPDESSRRLARNTQIIFKQEAFLSRVSDPVGGSYLIEALTNSIAARAWKLFQELESAGGYRKAVDTGLIASVLEKRLQSRDEAVALSDGALLQGQTVLRTRLNMRRSPLTHRNQLHPLAQRNILNHCGCAHNTTQAKPADGRASCWLKSATPRCAAPALNSPPISLPVPD